MKQLCVSLSAMLALSATGCRSFTSPARAHRLADGVTWVDYDATRRGGFILAKDGGQKMVSEPSPDVALRVVGDFIAKGSYKGISGDASTKVTESISRLRKPRQTVLV